MLAPYRYAARYGFPMPPIPLHNAVWTIGQPAKPAPTAPHRCLFPQPPVPPAFLPVSHAARRAHVPP
ncbi:hypothetical protein NM518_2201 [Neisseria meningitidis NM518]|nr:hypothetical protein NM518_2201 [Neisseria meningitidis NM518]